MRIIRHGSRDGGAHTSVVVLDSAGQADFQGLSIHPRGDAKIPNKVFDHSRANCAVIRT